MIHIDVEKELISAHGRINLKIQATLGKGELVVLFGDSGAGKTTLLRMLSGLKPPDKGVIEWGNDTRFHSSKKTNLPPHARNIVYMFQDYR